MESRTEIAESTEMFMKLDYEMEHGNYSDDGEINYIEFHKGKNRICVDLSDGTIRYSIEFACALVQNYELEKATKKLLEEVKEHLESQKHPKN